MPTPSSPHDRRCDRCGHLNSYHTTDACYGNLEEWQTTPCSCRGYERRPFTDEQEQRILSLIDERLKTHRELSSR